MIGCVIPHLSTRLPHGFPVTDSITSPSDVLPASPAAPHLTTGVSVYIADIWHAGFNQTGHCVCICGHVCAHPPAWHLCVSACCYVRRVFMFLWPSYAKKKAIHTPKHVEHGETLVCLCIIPSAAATKQLYVPSFSLHWVPVYTCSVFRMSQ